MSEIPSLLKSVHADHKNYPEKSEMQNKLKLYPNPAGTFFIIEYKVENTNTNNSILISNLIGQTTKTILLKSTQNQIVISTDSFSSGTYLIQLFEGVNLKESHKIEILL